ncbi:hypothetical protein FEM41_22070 [Jejubacter calystegiae]|uniref:Uncharacterized protein n=1 Tax=Jejubacter calystegiae TaxID=2579935 RepID=A0A4P8YMS2_9ENTR|nr:hypothetical protein [Jejubacter calystegiae]QCT22139.1 hypothetical protein FEM41_22070 [Jejubacter calystegiae]
MRELNVCEVNEVSGAGIIDDTLTSIGNQIGTGIDNITGGNTSASALSSVGHQIGQVIETSITNFLNNVFDFLGLSKA